MDRETLKKAIKHYGRIMQMLKANEEMGELIQAINKFLTAKNGEPSRKAIANMVEETADCLIMLEQLRLILGPTAVDTVVEKKLARLEKRIGGA